MVIYTQIPDNARSASYLLGKHSYKCVGKLPSEVKFLTADDACGEYYRIVTSDDKVTVYGTTACAFNAAVGYLLRNGMCDTEARLENEFRSVYFANHFHNYYHEAPTEELCEYLEELALWGQSVLCMWFDMHHFESIDDPKAQAMLERMNILFKKARELGMKTALTRLANEYYSKSPDELKATNSLQNGYRVKPIGFYYTELCPSKAGSEELILDSFDELLAQFDEVGIDCIVLWPYDQGGCTCRDCAPWGSNGYLKIAEKSAVTARRRFADVKIVLSCWRFGSFTDGEWDGLLPLLDDGFFADALMVDIAAALPDELSEKGIDVLSFPEISMYAAVPWGGYGANPFPTVLKSQFDRFGGLINGGSLYSEGCYEDINKAVSLRLMAQPQLSVRDIVHEYCGYYFGTDAADELCDIVMRLENTLYRSVYDTKGGKCDYPTEIPDGLYRYDIHKADDVPPLKSALENAEKHMTAEAVASWRYRLIYARVMGDAELVQNGGIPNDKTDEIYSELVRLYHAENAYYFVAPITRKSILANHGRELLL